MYALERTTRLFTVKNLKVLSFGCGPCTDLFAIDCLRENGTLTYDTLEYHGIDYSESVWKNIHDDIKSFENDKIKISFFTRMLAKSSMIFPKEHGFQTLLCFNMFFLIWKNILAVII